MNKFDPAINELESRLDVMKTNIPINERDGRKGQAELERKIATSVTGAIARLKESPFGKKNVEHK